MDKAYLSDLKDWLKWYNYHRSMISNMPVERKVEFLMKANYGAVKLIAGLVDEVIALERGNVPQPRHLLLPPWIHS